MKKTFVIMAVLILSACSVKEPTLDEKFLKRFEGYSTLESTASGSILKIEQGGKKLASTASALSFTFIKASSETTAVYSGQANEITFIFTAKEAFTLDGTPGILKK